VLEWFGGCAGVVLEWLGVAWKVLEWCWSSLEGVRMVLEWSGWSGMHWMSWVGVGDMGNVLEKQ
jgi:hypothetical protein